MKRPLIFDYKTEIPIIRHPLNLIFNKKNISQFIILIIFGNKYYI